MIEAVTRGLASALVTAMLAVGPVDGCKKSGGARESTEPPPPPPSTATAPPIWAAPEAPPPTVVAPAVNADVLKGRQLAQAGEHKKVRVLLEKRVRAGTATRDEVTLVLEACVALRDKACVQAIRAKYPDAAE